MNDAFQSPQNANYLSLQRQGTEALAVRHLRILATTDIHMQLVGHDYIRDAPLPHHGLAGLATLIRQARSEADQMGAASVLFDNGDLLQGSALGDTLAHTAVCDDHPVVQCIKALQYDAMGVGNHDLDHGLAYLLEIARHSPAPMISSNLLPNEPASLSRSALVQADVPPNGNRPAAALKIGVLSALPDQTGLWNRNVLCRKATLAPMIESLTAAEKNLRGRGADIIILLAHLGIDATETRQQNDALTLAALPGIDAIVAGHTHLRLPGLDHKNVKGVDIVNSTLADRPAAMPGFDASDLAVLDLKLVQGASGGWRVQTHKTALRPNTSEVSPDPDIAALCAPAHVKTRNALARQVGHTNVALHNFFSLAMPTTTCAIVAEAKRSVVQHELQGRPEANLPILAAASAHTAGGRHGPNHFLHIPAGPILRRHLTGLSPYENRICGLRVTGADLQGWLEHKAQVFNHLQPDCPDQELVQKKRPSFDFDTIYGLTYQIDPTRPAGSRIVSLTHAGRPVGPDQAFILATNSFRAAGGGGGVQFSAQDIIVQSDTRLDRALCTLLERPTRPTWCDPMPWRFSCAQGTRAILYTSRDAAAYMNDIAHLQPELLGESAAGFAMIRLTLRALHPASGHPI